MKPSQPRRLLRARLAYGSLHSQKPRNATRSESNHRAPHEVQVHRLLDLPDLVEQRRGVGAHGLRDLPQALPDGLTPRAAKGCAEGEGFGVKSGRGVNLSPPSVPRGVPSLFSAPSAPPPPFFLTRFPWKENKIKRLEFLEMVDPFGLIFSGDHMEAGNAQC